MNTLDRAEQNHKKILAELEEERLQKIAKENEHQEMIRQRQELEQRKKDMQNTETLHKMSKSFDLAEERKHQYIREMLKSHILYQLKEEEVRRTNHRGEKMIEYKAQKLTEKYNKEEQQHQKILHERQKSLKEKKALQAAFEKEKKTLLEEFERKKREVEHEAARMNRYQKPVSPNRSTLDSSSIIRSTSPITRPKTEQSKRSTRSTQRKPTTNRRNISNLTAKPSINSFNLTDLSTTIGLRDDGKDRNGKLISG